MPTPSDSELDRVTGELAGATDELVKRTARRAQVRAAILNLLALGLDMAERVVVQAVLTELEREWSRPRG